MNTDPSERSDASEPPPEPPAPAAADRQEPATADTARQPDSDTPQQVEETSASEPEATSTAPEAPPDEGSSEVGATEEKPSRRKILIGSQRDPEAYRPKPKRDWAPVEGRPADRERHRGPRADQPTSPEEEVREPAVTAEEPPGRTAVDELGPSPPGRASGKKFPPPNIRGQLPPDLEEEFEQALADAPLEDLIAAGDAVTKQTLLEPESKHTGRVVAVGREDVFLELGGREQGIVPLTQFTAPPEEGAELEVRVRRFNSEDGLYELSLPGSATEVADWSELDEGMFVDARVTGHNTGGLECEVHHVRGFIPVSQISLYRVENLEEFVGEKFTCLVTECNAERRNLVLSRRAVLEKQREEARQELLQSLEPGQVHEGVVRRLMDFGAFVDLGGVDGLVHISQLGWGRVNHPSEVLQEGQTVKVKVERIDRQTGKIGLAYRDLLANPWEDADRKYPPTSTQRGRVSKIMEFGAFVELEPGVEGLVHISELSHKRVWRVTDVVSEGEEIDVVVLSVDTENQRISLSMKDLTPAPEPEAEKEQVDDAKSRPAGKSAPKLKGPLKGGLGRSAGGEGFGLKW